MRICLKQGISGGFKHKEPKKKTCQLSVIITLNGITYQHVCIIISAAPWLNDSTVAMEFMGQKWGQVGWRPIKVIDGWESPRLSLKETKHSLWAEGVSAAPNSSAPLRQTLSPPSASSAQCTENGPDKCRKTPSFWCVSSSPLPSHLTPQSARLWQRHLSSGGLTSH